jgi:hypothetical protein
MRDRAEAAADGADTKAVAAEALVVPSITKSSHFQRKLTKRLKFSESAPPVPPSTAWLVRDGH